MLRAETVAISLLLALTAVGGSAHAATFYKYKDDTDHWVMSHNIPADRVKYGYLVVDENGRTVDEVPPQLSDEEYQAKLAREAAVRACDAAVLRVRKLYQSLDDIDHAEVQALESIDNSVANIRANLTHIKNQKKELEARAAQMDIAGQSLPPGLLVNIEKARNEQRNLEDAIEAKISEKDELALAFSYDRVVFRLADCTDGLPPASRLAVADADAEPANR